MAAVVKPKGAFEAVVWPAVFTAITLQNRDVDAGSGLVAGRVKVTVFAGIVVLENTNVFAAKVFAVAI